LLHTPIQGLGLLDLSSTIVRILPLPVLRLPEFLVGMAIGLRYLNQTRDISASRSSLYLYLAVAGIFHFLSLPLGVWVSLVAIPFTVLVYELAAGDTLLVKFLSTRLMLLLGGASYAVYLLQFPVRSWTRVFFQHLPNGFARFGAPATPFILVGFSILVFRFREEPCRWALRSWLGDRRPAKAEPDSSPSTT
jgi:peptidoglycan/LPS O-acetylase OafA/YrhL